MRGHLSLESATTRKSPGRDRIGCLGDDVTQPGGETLTLYSHEDFRVPDAATFPELPLDPDGPEGPSRLEALLR